MLREKLIIKNIKEKLSDAKDILGYKSINMVVTALRLSSLIRRTGMSLDKSEHLNYTAK